MDKLFHILFWASWEVSSLFSHSKIEHESFTFWINWEAYLSKTYNLHKQHLIILNIIFYQAYQTKVSSELVKIIFARKC